MRTVRGFFFSFVIAALVVGVSSLPALADEETDARTFEAERALAETEAADPEVAAWRALIQPDLDHVLGTAFLRCARRELYSRSRDPGPGPRARSRRDDLGGDDEDRQPDGRLLLRRPVRRRLPAPPSPVRISIASPATQ